VDRLVAVVPQQMERTQEKLAQQMSIQTEELRAVLSTPRLPHLAPRPSLAPRHLFVSARRASEEENEDACTELLPFERPRHPSAHGHRGACTNETQTRVFTAPSRSLAANKLVGRCERLQEWRGALRAA
jgi:hypothetical protein